MIVGRIGVGQVAADGGHVAHQRIGDDHGRLVDDGVLLANQIGGVEVRLAGERADGQRTVRLANVREVGEAVDVDQMLRRRHPQFHQRDQALTAGQDLGVRAVPLEKR